MKEKLELRQFLGRVKRAVMVLAVFQGTLRSLSFMAVYFGVLLGVDEKFHCPLAARHLLWVLGVGGGAGFFLSGFWPFSLFRLKTQSLLLSVQNSKGVLREDDLVLAQELGAMEDVQPEAALTRQIRADAVGFLQKRLSAVSPWTAFPSWPWRRALLFSVILCAVSGASALFLPRSTPVQRVLFPFGGGALNHKLRIIPGNAAVPFGGSARVELEPLVQTLEKPALYVKNPSGWALLQPDREELGVRGYSFTSLVQPLEYKVHFMDERSEVFRLTPRVPVQFVSFSVRVTPPAYVGGTPKIQTTPDIQGLKGSRVDFDGVLNKPVSSAQTKFSFGREQPVTVENDSHVSVHFLLDQAGSLQFLFTEPGATAVLSPAVYAITLLNDAPPVITLLSPSEDLLISGQETLPLTFEAKDDFGLSHLSLVVERAGGAGNEKTLASLDKKPLELVQTVNWFLMNENLRAGEVVRYRLKATDSNSLTGPGISFSDWRTLEIKSFEENHEALDRSLESWRKEAVSVLADMNELKYSLSKSSVNWPTEEAAGKALESSTQNLGKKLEKIVAAMENDVMADYKNWLEHKSMAENLSLMNQTLSPELARELTQQNAPASLATVSQMAAELERMTALSETLSKEQNESDLAAAAQNMEEAGKSMLSTLDEVMKKGALDQKSLNDVRRLMDQAQENLLKAAQALQKDSPSLPDDFVNQEALKKLDLDSPQDLLSQIEKALQQGDVQKALALAKEFLKMSEQVNAQIQKAHEKAQSGRSADALSKEWAAKQAALDKIISEQELLLTETQKVELKRLAQSTTTLSMADQSLLHQLAPTQDNVAQETKVLEKDLAVLSRQTAMVGFGLTHKLAKAQERMKEASEELHAGASAAAFSAESEALRILREASESLSEAQESAASGDGMPGGGRSMKALPRSSGMGGGSGMNRQKVLMPRVEDFKPPKAFREELLEALKEKRPASYENIIQKYYKHLAE